MNPSGCKIAWHLKRSSSNIMTFGRVYLLALISLEERLEGSARVGSV